MTESDSSFCPCITVDAPSYCQAHPRDIIPMKDNCAHYIDCARVLAGASEPVSECTYPDLFSTLSMTCQAFTTVQCDTRPEPQAPCKYTTGITPYINPAVTKLA